MSRRSMLVTPAVSLVVAIVLFAAQNVAAERLFPELPRLTTDFSAAYLQRELRDLAARRGETLFLGDSVLWGYGLPVRQTMVSILTSQGCACRNLAFKAGSPPNYYVLVRLLETAGVRPKAVVIEINQKVFSPTDSSYQTLAPALAELGAQYLTPQDRMKLQIAPRNPLQVRFERFLGSLWSAYAMRTDIRETILGESDANPPARRPTADDFAGAYDLTPLTKTNVAVFFLQKTVNALRRAGIPAIAFMSPANHTLLHDYIDAPEYRANNTYLRRLLERQGVRVVDLDRAIPARDFFDNDHMTVSGQRRFASLLGAYVR